MMASSSLSKQIEKIENDLNGEEDKVVVVVVVDEELSASPHPFGPHSLTNEVSNLLAPGIPHMLSIGIST